MSLFATRRLETGTRLTRPPNVIARYSRVGDAAVFDPSRLPWTEMLEDCWVYDVLAWEREGSDLALAHCWVHVRRKFAEAEPHYPKASEILDRIGQLHAIEAEAKRASPQERLARLAALRAKQSKPVLDEIRTWLMTQRELPGSSLGKAIAYTSGLWPGLVRFLGDPKIPLVRQRRYRGSIDLSLPRSLSPRRPRKQPGPHSQRTREAVMS